MTIDPELGLVYLPVEMPTNDYYGGHRLGDNLFSDSLVALDLETGERRWHFQITHHDVWDWDLPAGPVLADITVDGRDIKAVALPTKQSWLFVFDRETGEPVWPIEERPVAASDIPGEILAPTQPHPTRPPAFDQQGIGPDDLIDFTPELKARAMEVLNRFRYGRSIYTPPSVGAADGTYGTLQVPASTGGVNWPGGSLDPETGVFYQYSKTEVTNLGLVNDPERSDMAFIRGRPEGVSARQEALNVEGIPIIKPPWGRISAIDLNTGEILWQAPHGETADNIRNHRLLEGGRRPADRPAGTGRDAGHQDAGDRRRRRQLHQRGRRVGRDAAGLRQADRRGARRGADADAADRVADDVHGRRATAHRRRCERRRLRRAADGVPAAMIVGVPREAFPGERRVALVPGALTPLKKASLDVVVETAAGAEAGFPDAAYAEQGARIVESHAGLFAEADVVLQVRSPGAAGEAGRADVGLLRSGQTIIGFSEPLGEPAVAQAVAERGANAIAMELVPRITRAQSMDALSSMATIAGYKAVLLAAGALPRMFPMMMTAAGHDHPGAGLRRRRRRGRPAGDRLGAPPRRAGGGLRRASGREGTGGEPRRRVRGAAARDRRRGRRRRLREGAGRVVLPAPARDDDARRRKRATSSSRPHSYPGRTARSW